MDTASNPPLAPRGRSKPPCRLPFNAPVETGSSCGAAAGVAEGASEVPVANRTSHGDHENAVGLASRVLFAAFRDDEHGRVAQPRMGREHHRELADHALLD